MNDLNYFGPSTNFSAEFVFKLQYLGIQIRSSQLHYLLSLYSIYLIVITYIQPRKYKIILFVIIINILCDKDKFGDNFSLIWIWLETPKMFGADKNNCFVQFGLKLVTLRLWHRPDADALTSWAKSELTQLTRSITLHE